MFHLGYYLESSGNCITLLKYNRILFLDLPDELKSNKIPYQNSFLCSFKNMRTKPSMYCLPLLIALLISLNHVPNPFPEPLSNDMNTDGYAEGDIDTDFIIIINFSKDFFYIFLFGGKEDPLTRLMMELKYT